MVVGGRAGVARQQPFFSGGGRLVSVRTVPSRDSVPLATHGRRSPGTRRSRAHTKPARGG